MILTMSLVGSKVEASFRIHVQRVYRLMRDSLNSGRVPKLATGCFEYCFHPDP